MKHHLAAKLTLILQQLDQQGQLQSDIRSKKTQLWRSRAMGLLGRFWG